ncbi:hypothetical protein NHX12_028867 [Muraenolepis orangiensis]|uniref:Uncharacterized protein n=1 Tax=Muraenolepis orangiensis TaxID=630683 RepID=A0A9Q0EE43_9TELE|nr:hypothetical protein NHX12_028867 [Muraenolepis orangiensis]
MAPPPPRALTGNVGGAKSLAQQGDCREGLEYRQDNICCLNCLAGEHMTSACVRPGEQGSCSACGEGTYTEHGNGLHACLPCSKCRSDQVVVQDCSRTQNAECQCRPGRFCISDQACEVCKKCQRCKDGEEETRNCTAHSDTECSRSLTPIKPWSMSAKSRSLDCSLADDACQVSMEDQQNRPKASVTDDDTDGGLGESSSENSLFVHAGQIPDQAPSPGISRWPSARNDDFPQLVPLNGELSLKKSFECFDEVDVRYHKRFFRSLDISDNAIASAERHDPQDQVHELLVHWQEKVGKDASINHLLKMLRTLNQNRTAESIKKNVILNGLYEVQREEQCE